MLRVVVSLQTVVVVMEASSVVAIYICKINTLVLKWVIHLNQDAFGEINTVQRQISNIKVIIIQMQTCIEKDTWKIYTLFGLYCNF